MFSDGIEKYGNIIDSGQPVLVKITIDKQNEDASPRIMINSLKLLDEAMDIIKDTFDKHFKVN